MRYKDNTGLKVGDKVRYMYEPKQGPDFAKSLPLAMGKIYTLREVDENNYVMLERCRDWWVHISQFSTIKLTNKERIRRRKEELCLDTK